jgi:hypothetical protein
MNCYFVGMRYGRSCTKFPYFVLIILLINMLAIGSLVCYWPIKQIFEIW